MLILPALLRRKRILRKLKQSGAISEQTAKTLGEAGILHPNAFKRITDRLVEEQILVKTKDNQYYLYQQK